LPWRASVRIGARWRQALPGDPADGGPDCSRRNHRAVMVQFPLPIVLEALAQLKEVFLSEEPESDALVQNLLRYALKARKEGLLSLDAEWPRFTIRS